MQGSIVMDVRCKGQLLWRLVYPVSGGVWGYRAQGWCGGGDKIQKKPRVCRSPGISGDLEPEIEHIALPLLREFRDNPGADREFLRRLPRVGQIDTLEIPAKRG